MNRELAAVAIRPMEPADLGRVASIAHSLPTAPQWPEPAYTRAMERDANHRRIALVAENAHREVLGFAIASLISPQAELETLVVAAEAQGRGIGRALLSRLLAAMKTFSITEVTIEVRPSNHSALSLYRSFGFIQVGRRSLYYADPAEDALVLTARIEAGASGGP